jgi:hypothetical protein
MANKTYKSYEEFHAAKNPGTKRPSAEGDPLERFYRPGSWFWTGEITEFEDSSAGPLPSTVFVESMEEAKAAAAKGWLPVEFIPDPVLDLLVAFHEGAERVPSALAAQLKAEKRLDRFAAKPK